MKEGGKESKGIRKKEGRKRRKRRKRKKGENEENVKGRK